MVTVEKLASEHVEDVVQLAQVRAKELRNSHPILPLSTFPDAAEVLKRAEAVPSFVAIRGGQLVGFLTGIPFENMHGRPTVYSPEWAHGTAPGEHTAFAHLYSAAAGVWREAGWQGHTFTTMIHDTLLLRVMQWQGFGGIVADAVASLDEIPSVEHPPEIRRATLADAASLTELSKGLVDHLASSPVLLRYPYPTLDGWQTTLSTARMVVLIAQCDGKDVAYLKMGPCADDVCTVIRAEDTTSISGAFCIPELRCQGIARALLHTGIQHARESGHYRRVGVDWESNNVEATEFWTRNFQPITLSVRRIVP